jgi:transcriptional regulator with XRE-family HTH domain
VATQVEALTSALLAITEGQDKTLEAAQAFDAAVKGSWSAAKANPPGDPWSTFSASFNGIVGGRIRELRDEAGWTQAQLAAAMEPYFKWGRVTVAEVETDVRRTTFEELLVLGALFGEPVVSFLIPTDETHLLMPTADLPPGRLREALLGRGGKVGRGGLGWSVAVQIADQPGPRPATDLWSKRTGTQR